MTHDAEEIWTYMHTHMHINTRIYHFVYTLSASGHGLCIRPQYARTAVNNLKRPTASPPRPFLHNDSIVLVVGGWRSELVGDVLGGSWLVLVAGGS